MFRSGAQTYGDRVVGVVLTGNLKDGVAGLTEITQRGGLSLAQDPAEAHAPSMPLNALACDDVDVVFRLEALSDVLKTLADGRGVSAALGIDGTRRPFDPSTADA
jgi:two-component system chemotaxis response regulator CheB